MRIATFIKTDGGCDEYRCTLPTEAMKRNQSDMKLLQLQIGDPLNKIIELLEAEIMFIPRLIGEHDEDLIDHIHSRGMKVVTDYDDNLFDISPFSNHYEDFGTKNIQIKQDNGQIINLWKDRETWNFDIKRNQKKLDSLKRCIEKCDAVMTTTDVLAGVYKEFSDHIYVAPNSVNLNDWVPTKVHRENKDEVRLYWSGGSSHYEDLILLQDVFPVIAKKYPQVKIIILGMNFRGITKHIPPEQFQFEEWVHTKAYPFKSRLMDIDISLIPLQDTRFNACKSNIKWIEQSSLLVPSVTSLVTPYKEHYNGVNGVFVENNSVDGWINGISHLIENPIERWKMGAEARKTVEQKFDINKNYKIWYDVFKEILDGK